MYLAGDLERPLCCAYPLDLECARLAYLCLPAGRAPAYLAEDLERLLRVAAYP